MVILETSAAGGSAESILLLLERNEDNTDWLRPEGMMPASAFNNKWPKWLSLKNCGTSSGGKHRLPASGSSASSLLFSAVPCTLPVIHCTSFQSSSSDSTVLRVFMEQLVTSHPVRSTAQSANYCSSNVLNTQGS